MWSEVSLSLLTFSWNKRMKLVLMTDLLLDWLEV